MDTHLLGLVSRLVQSAKTHGLLAAEAAAIACELDRRRHRGEAAIIRATARNHRIRQLEISANVAALKALLRPCQPSRS
jgi:hypothetical protein